MKGLQAHPHQSGDTACRAMPSSHLLVNKCTGLPAGCACPTSLGAAPSPLPEPLLPPACRSCAAAVRGLQINPEGMGRSVLSLGRRGWSGAPAVWGTGTPWCIPGRVVWLMVLGGGVQSLHPATKSEHPSVLGEEGGMDGWTSEWMDGWAEVSSQLEPLLSWGGMPRRGLVGASGPLPRGLQPALKQLTPWASLLAASCRSPWPVPVGDHPAGLDASAAPSGLSYTPQR